MSYRFMAVPERGLLQGSLTPLLTIGLLVFFVLLAVINWWYRSRVDTGMILADEIALLDDIFKKIHTSCKILNFDNQKTYINFLNVKKDGFIGSEIGSMNLAHPDKWEGPYVLENPKMFDHEYVILKTNNGYFIVPGDGVTLPNGKVVGKDVILDEQAEIAKMMVDDTALQFKGRPLAAVVKMN